VTWPLLAPLSPEERARVLAAARVRRYAKGEVVCHEGDPGEHVHLVRSGHLAVRKALPSGESATLSLVAPGESFGELALLGERRARTASVVALEASETLTLSRADFLGIRRQSGVDALLLEALVARVDQLSGALLEALYVGVDRRVIRRLVELAEMYPDTDQGHPVVPLTQDDLAGLAGATRPTVNQVLRRLATDRAVSLERGRIHVLDLEALRRRSGQ
jgi:CRP/FNR family cyclic AMP-dependent transcriptional regulator